MKKNLIQIGTGRIKKEGEPVRVFKRFFNPQGGSILWAIPEKTEDKNDKEKSNKK